MSLAGGEKARVYVPMRPESLRPMIAFDDAVASIDELHRRWPGCAVGVRAAAAGLLVIDVDVKNEAPGLETIKLLQREIGALPPTRTHRTKSGGWHLVFRVEAKLAIRSAQGELRGAQRPAPGIDIIAGGGALIRWAPGTRGYTVARAMDPVELPSAWARALVDPPEEKRPKRAELPAEDNRARRYALGALEREGVELERTAVMRNCALARAAGVLGQLTALTTDEITVVLLAACEANGSLKEHGLRACQKTIARGIRWGRAHPRAGEAA